MWGFVFVRFIFFIKVGIWKLLFDMIIFLRSINVFFFIIFLGEDNWYFF